MYPDNDRHHRPALLEKYFPLLSGDCGRRAPACVVKYLPPVQKIFADPGAAAPRGYTAASPSYAGPGARPLFESAFGHKFYTGWDFETRVEIPLKIGFYYAEAPQDRAWLLNRDGLCAFKNGRFGDAESAFGEALKLDPGCGDCAINLAAGLAFGGKKAEALRRIAAAEAAGPAEEEGALLAALRRAAEGDSAAAAEQLDAFIRRDQVGGRLSMAFAYRMALTAGLAGGQRAQGPRP